MVYGEQLMQFSLTQSNFTKIQSEIVAFERVKIGGGSVNTMEDDYYVSQTQFNNK